MGKTIWGLFYVWVKIMLLCCEIEPQGSPRGQGPLRFGFSELAQQADEPQMGKTIWGLFYVWVKMMLLRCEMEPQGSPRGQGPPRMKFLHCLWQCLLRKGKAFQIRIFRRPR